MCFESLAWAHTHGIRCEGTKEGLICALMQSYFCWFPLYAGIYVISMLFDGSNYLESKGDHTLGWRGRKITAPKAVGVYRERFISENAVL